MRRARARGHPATAATRFGRRAYSESVRIPSSLAQNKVLFKASVVVRLLVAAVVGGALVAGLSLPAVGALGTVVRNGATKFNTLGTPELHQLPVRSAILDRHGKVLAYYYPRNIDRVPVTYSQIAPVMRQAIVAIEDDRFYQHGAIDFRGTVRALVNDLQHKSVQGGSTLAQQYVKNVEILSSPNPQAVAAATAQTVGRKIRELRMAVRAEHTMSKDQILAGYLNAAFFGNQSYGIEVGAERYYSTSAAKLTLPQAAMLAGIVENPSLYNPLGSASQVQQTLARRNTVLARMAQLHQIPASTAAAAEKTKLDLNPSLPQSGCTSRSAKYAAYMCDYVIAVIKHDTQYKQVWNRLNGIGGLTITTTLDPKDQRAANNAVNHMVPPPPNPNNPGGNADTEVLIQPGTGRVRAIAIDRPYGNGKHQNVINYAVGPQYHGSQGWQLGSAGKVWTMVAAIEQGIPFGYSKHVNGTATVSGYTNCKGQILAPWHLTNDQSELASATYSLYTGTTQSINVFFAYLEQKVGLCNVIKTAAQDGPDLAGREVAAQAGPPGAPPGERGQRSVLHAGRRQPGTDRRCRLRRHPARAWHLLQPDRDHQDRDEYRAAPAGGVGPLSPRAVPGGRGRGQLHPHGRPDQRHSGGGLDREAVRVQDRDRGLLRVGFLRGLHAAASGRGLGRQPARQH